jgi:hypothetical protein
LPFPDVDGDDDAESDGDAELEADDDFHQIFFINTSAITHLACGNNDSLTHLPFFPHTLYQHSLFIPSGGFFSFAYLRRVDDVVRVLRSRLTDVRATTAATVADATAAAAAADDSDGMEGNGNGDDAFFSSRPVAAWADAVGVLLSRCEIVQVRVLTPRPGNHYLLTHCSSSYINLTSLLSKHSLFYSFL